MYHFLGRGDGSVVCNCCCPSPAQSFSDPSPAGLMTTFYSLRFETPPNPEVQVPVFISRRNTVAQLYRQTLGSLTVTSNDSQGYGGVIRPQLKSQSQSYFATGGLPPITSSWRQAPWDPRYIYLFNWTLAVIVFMQRRLWREDGLVSYEYAWPFVKCMYHTYSMLLRILPFALYTNLLSVEALQSRSCLSYVSYATTAA
jgi:hypothetical protein